MRANLVIEPKMVRKDEKSTYWIQIIREDELVAEIKVGENAYKDVFMAVAEVREENRRAGKPNL